MSDQKLAEEQSTELEDQLPRTFLLIDTQYVIDRGFDFDKGPLHDLKQLVARKNVAIVSTTITDMEIIKHIREKGKEFEFKLKNVRNNTFSTNVLDDSIDECLGQKLADARIKKYELFKSETSTNVLSADNLNFDKIFDDYQKQNPPFTQGKKNEFPDAITCYVLERWCEKQNLNVTVISGDRDMSVYSKKSKRIKVEKNTVDLYQRYQEAYVLRCMIESENTAVRILSDFENPIKERIIVSFNELSFSPEDVADGEVDSVQVTDIEFEGHTVSGYDAEESTLDVKLRVKIQATVDVSYGDENCMYRDPDTRDFVYLETASSEVELDNHHTISIKFVNVNESAIMDIEDLSFDDIGWCYSFQVHGYPY